MGGGGLRILRHKSWHVGRADNKLRVARDEAKHREQLERDRATERQRGTEKRLEILRRQLQKEDHQSSDTDVVSASSLPRERQENAGNTPVPEAKNSRKKEDSGVRLGGRQHIPWYMETTKTKKNDMFAGERDPLDIIRESRQARVQSHASHHRGMTERELGRDSMQTGSHPGEDGPASTICIQSSADETRPAARSDKTKYSSEIIDLDVTSTEEEEQPSKARRSHNRTRSHSLIQDDDRKRKRSRSRSRSRDRGRSRSRSRSPSRSRSRGRRSRSSDRTSKIRRTARSRRRSRSRDRDSKKSEARSHRHRNRSRLHSRSRSRSRNRDSASGRRNRSSSRDRDTHRADKRQSGREELEARPICEESNCNIVRKSAYIDDSGSDLEIIDVDSLRQERLMREAMERARLANMVRHE